MHLEETVSERKQHTQEMKVGQTALGNLENVPEINKQAVMPACHYFCFC